jgi:acyl-CoA thioester hydrolase
MEEARVDFMSQIGWDYARLEKEGVICPVVGLSCSYKESTTFSDVITIEVTVREYKGVKLKLSYIMKNVDGKVVFEGDSEHCFLNSSGNLIRLNRSYPELYDALVALVTDN